MRETRHLLADKEWGWKMQLCRVAPGCQPLYPRGLVPMISLSFPSMLGLISWETGWRIPLSYTGRTHKG